MYVKVYISRMEMTQKIHFWHPHLLKITIFFEKIAKNHFFGQKGQKKFRTSYTTQFSVKMLKKTA